MPLNSEIPNIDNNDVQSLGSILPSSNTNNNKLNIQQIQLQQQQKFVKQQPKIIDRKNTFVIKNSGKIKKRNKI